MVENLITDLLGINCQYNFKVMSDGKCRSNQCMLNQDPEIKGDIAEKGCEIYKKLKTYSYLNKSEQTPIQRRANEQNR